MPGYAPSFGDTATNVPVNTTPLVSRIAKNALIGTTTGAAPGVATTASKTKVKNTPDNAGKAQLEVQTDINRASTAADVTAIKASTTKKRPTFAFARDLSGNGGPAFTRT